MFDWGEYLVLAQYLANFDDRDVSVSREAITRTAISRAYYAIFGLAQDYAKQYLGFTPYAKKRNSPHRDLIDFYKRINKPQFRIMANDIRRLRDWRNKCDYEANAKICLEDVETALTIAQKILNRFSS
ncbi:MAG TPA: hypothetical protein GXX39_08975 [Syntrophothermus lipocalidus]|uniref:HEPN domain protein n=1 Tax=Syntrophothermus lipocalidus (strain DSM 12680 / TGB-C1) TaxID=643648 RepID=D7CPU5_SYNLT|nr:hypothetical protein [Syntrophothermus lipocalidus]ADI02723.1 conserved hypothetical protein [Syntrophothermus lipocalidus DSM 12680]HHV77488.1 hypothetical protein [Syntrophothermus lipocalidus]HOV42415.1 hypothetical protein [Syntrophothermus lipocalidus]